MILKKEMFGKKWPFKPAIVTIWKADVYAVVIYQYNGYALNGMAKNVGFLALEPIWKENKKIPGTRKSLQPIFDYIGL